MPRRKCAARGVRIGDVEKHGTSNVCDERAEQVVGDPRFVCEEGADLVPVGALTAQSPTEQPIAVEDRPAHCAGHRQPRGEERRTLGRKQLPLIRSQRFEWDRSCVDQLAGRRRRVSRLEHMPCRPVVGDETVTGVGLLLFDDGVEAGNAAFEVCAAGAPKSKTVPTTAHLT
jgi:hypothetical protein